MWALGFNAVECRLFRGAKAWNEQLLGSSFQIRLRSRFVYNNLLPRCLLRFDGNRIGSSSLKENSAAQPGRCDPEIPGASSFGQEGTVWFQCL